MLAFAAPALTAQEYGPAKPVVIPDVAIPLTPEQKESLRAVDVRLAGVEALAAKVNDPEYKATVDAQVRDLKKRRLALEKKFDAGLYEVLMHAVISRYQVIALWLAPPRVTTPVGAAPRS